MATVGVKGLKSSLDSIALANYFGLCVFERSCHAKPAVHSAVLQDGVTEVEAISCPVVFRATRSTCQPGV